MTFTDKTIQQLATIVFHDWKKVSAPAVPYLDAMLTMVSIDDNYGYDSGLEIVSRFLCNAQGWRGEVAREVKSELLFRLEQSGEMESRMP